MPRLCSWVAVLAVTWLWDWECGWYGGQSARAAPESCLQLGSWGTLTLLLGVLSSAEQGAVPVNQRYKEASGHETAVCL